MDLITNLVSKREKIEFSDDRCCNPMLCNNLLSIKVLDKNDYAIELRFQEERIVFSFKDEEIGKKNLEFLLKHCKDSLLDLSNCSAAMLFSEFDRMTAKIRVDDDRYAKIDYDGYLDRNSKLFSIGGKVEQVEDEEEKS